MASLKYRISLNLGGGAARGLAHIGVLRSLEESAIAYDIIIGVSMGAFIGNIYAIVPESDFVKNRVRQWLNSDAVQNSVVMSYHKRMKESARNIIKKINAFATRTGVLGRTLLTPAMLAAEEVSEAFYPYIAPINLENTRLPFACNAVSLNTGAISVFSSGPMRPAVLASAAMPMVFPPVEIGGQYYCDGGVLDKVGLDAAQMLKVKKTIVVDVSNENSEPVALRNALDIMLRTEEIASIYRRERQLKKATVVLRPIRGNIHWADYSMIDEMIDMGYEETRNKTAEIREKLGLTNPFRRLFSMFRRRMTR